MLQQNETEDQITKNVRLKLNSEVQKYQDASISLSKPTPFIRFPDENATNSHISDIMYDAAYILNQMTSKKFDFSKMSSGLPPEAATLFNLDEPIQQLKEQVEELSFDVENQSIKFEEATTTAHQILSDQIIALQKGYQSRIAKLVIENSNEEEQLEKKLENLHEKLDQQLEKEFSAQIAERDEIKRRLVNLKQKYEEANNMINSQNNLSTAAHKSNSQTSFSVSPPTSTAASIISNVSTTAKNPVSSLNGDDNFTSSISNEVSTHSKIKRKGRARGMAIEKSMPSITRDRSLNASSDALNANDNNNDNSDTLTDNIPENNRVSSSLYYENTTTEENSASLINEPQIEEEEEYAISDGSYENCNEKGTYPVSINSIDIENQSEKNDIGYYNKKAEKAYSEKQNLTDEMYSLQNYYSREKNRLHEIIIKSRNVTEASLQKQLEKQKSNYQRKRRQFDELFKQRQKDLNKKIAAAEESKVSSAQKIRKEIEDKKKLINDSNSIIHKQLGDIERKMNDEIIKIDDEINQLKARNEKEIQELKNNRLENANQIQKFPVRPPSSSPNSPSNSPRGDAKSLQMKKIENQINSSSSDIDAKFESFKRASSNEIYYINRAIKIADDQYNIYHQIQQNKIDTARAHLNTIQQKKDLVSLKIKYLNMILNNINADPKINVHEQQKQQIEQLDEALQSMANDKSEKVELQVIQDEMSAEKASKLDYLESIKAKLEQIESEFNNEYNSLIKEENNRRLKQLKSITSAQSEAEQQINDSRKYINESSIKGPNLNDHDADQSNEQNQHTDPSVQRIQMESKCISTLPLLKH
ncbi:hypothetical protein M9Y10_021156 [Tritrichomonas musculus]|uniref:DUF4709 domain-containing protein n=1 Tax=Tritrichomonas musculus TaxID=1915356 RepID=A0ABR2HE75_9EUKA